MEEMNQEATTEATPSEEGQVTEAAQTEPEGDVSSSPQSEGQTEFPTGKTVPHDDGQDAKINYEDLRKQYDTINKSYAELRREFTRRTQYESELQKRLDSLTDTINKATEEPINPEQFFKDLQAKGPKAFEPLWAKREEALKSEFSKVLEQEQGERINMQYQMGKLTRRMDNDNYPDFRELEPVMAQLAQDESVPLDLSRTPDEVLDTLYKLAKNLNADNAVKKARELGRNEAESQAAKEADASVAAGGKTGSTTNPADIKDINKLRQYFVNQIGEAE